MNDNFQNAGKVLALTSALLSASVLATSAHAAISFSEATSAAGFTYVGESWGVSWGDLNGDGRPDLFMNNHRLHNSMYINNGDGTFTDKADEVDLSGTWTTEYNSDTHGASWADFDNDGDQDLMVSNGFSTGWKLFENTGGKLLDVTSTYGFSRMSTGSGRHPIWLDYNNDGRLDMLADFNSNYSRLYRQNSDGSFYNTSTNYQSCYSNHHGNLSDVNVDGKLDLVCVEGNTMPDRIYDMSTLPFTNITSIMPTVDAAQDTVFADLNGDLRPDAIAVRGAKRPSDAALVNDHRIEAQLTKGGSNEVSFNFVSDGVLTVNFSWETINSTSGVWIGSGSKHPSSFDFTLDPNDSSNWGIRSHSARYDRGVYIGYNPTTRRWTFLLSAGNRWNDTAYVIESTLPMSDIQFEGQYAFDLPMKPSIMLNTTSGFVESRKEVGMNDYISCISIAAADFDNDMDVDLYFACRGGVTNLPNMLYENQGDGTFILVPGSGGAGGVTGAQIADGVGISESVVTADYDSDGFIDLFVTNGMNMFDDRSGGPIQLFRNNGNSNRWVEIDLEGVSSNRDGIGAKVFATAGGKTQLRESNGGYHRWSQDHKRLHFGLAGNNTVDLRVEWPSGNVDTFSNVDANHVYKIVEGGAITVLPIGNDMPPALSASDVTVSESDGQAVFSVSLSPASSQVVTVEVTTANGSAVSPDDYAAIPTTLLTFNPGETIQTVAVPIADDSLPEGTENFSLNLSNPTNATLAKAIGTGTILDSSASPCGEPVYDRASEAAVVIWQDCATQVWSLRVTAGGQSLYYSGNLESNLNFVSVLPVSIETNDILDTSSDPMRIDFGLYVGGSGQDGFDFTMPVGANACFRLTEPTVPVYMGASRTLLVAPFNFTNFGACAPAQPSLTVSDVTASEGDGQANFTVSLVPASTGEVTVDVQTVDGSAVAPDDYAALVPSVTLTFAPGETSKSVVIPLVDDTQMEGTEDFTVTLSNASNALITKGSGTATILDNETSPCDQPAFDKATEAGVFIWQDCATQTWNVRVTAGGQALTYAGNVNSSADLVNVAGFSIETNDILDNVSNTMRIDYSLNVASAGQDGFSFNAPAVNTCFTLDAPAVPVYLGASRTQMTNSFDLNTLGACN